MKIVNFWHPSSVKINLGRWVVTIYWSQWHQPHLRCAVGPEEILIRFRSHQKMNQKELDWENPFHLMLFSEGSNRKVVKKTEKSVQLEIRGILEIARGNLQVIKIPQSQIYQSLLLSVSILIQVSNVALLYICCKRCIDDFFKEFKPLYNILFFNHFKIALMKQQLTKMKSICLK